MFGKMGKNVGFAVGFPFSDKLLGAERKTFSRKGRKRRKCKNNTSFSLRSLRFLRLNSVFLCLASAVKLVFITKV